MRHHFKTFFKGLLCIVAVLALLSSCSSSEDEPVMTVGYYLAMDSQEIIGLSETEDLNGTNLPPENHNIFMTIIKMRQALRKEFSKPRQQGNDGRVIAICDSCFRESIYYGSHGATICTARLIRTSQNGDRVLRSQQLKLYRFNKMVIMY